MRDASGYVLLSRRQHQPGSSSALAARAVRPAAAPSPRAAHRLERITGDDGAPPVAVVQRVYNAGDNQQTLSTGERLREVFKRIRAGGWTFPNQATGDGKIYPTTVSKRANVTGPNATETMAVHATFEIESVVVPSSQTIGTTAVNVNVNNNHLTMRPKVVQDIADQGSSAYTAARAAHCNQNGWGWRHLENIQSVNGFAGATAVGLEGALTGAGHDAAAVATLGQNVVRNIQYSVDTNPAAPIVTVTAGNNWQQ